MKKIYLLIVLFSFVFYHTQKRTEDFQISIPENRSIVGAFKTIDLIDARPDTTNVGIVQKGAFNAKAKVLPAVPLEKQFQDLLSKIVNSQSEDGELLIYLKQFYFAEVTGAMSEKGYCYFQAYLFAKNNDGKYQLLDEADSVVVHSSLDVTKAIMKKGSELVSNFIIKNIYKKNITTDSYTYEEVVNYDNIAKQKFALYNKETLVDGLYNDFKDFQNQTPNDVAVKNIKSTPDGMKVYKVYADKDGKGKEVKKSDYYGLIYQGIPYVHSDIDNAFVKMERRNDGDYYFTAKAKSTAKTGNVALASAFFGIIGGLIASDSNSLFEMKLDYLNGGFIPLKVIK